jgi:UDP-glucose 4-epimerase
MKRVLISGVCGLIGSHLADKLLESGYHVTGIDNLSNGSIENIRQALKNKNFVFRKLDCAMGSKVIRIFGNKRFDLVIHMAALKKIEERESSLKVLLNNVNSTQSLLNLARRLKAKFIFASTSDVYGMSEDLPFKENGNSVLGPSYIKRWSYAISKLYCESLVFAYKYEYGLPVVILRYFGCFSPRSNYGPSGGHVPLFIKNALKGKSITIHGDGRQTRCMCFIDDTVKGTLLALDNEKAIGKIINIGSSEELSIKDSAKIIIDVARKITKTARNSKLRYIPMKDVFGDYKEIARRAPDLKNARNILGYLPSINFKKAVELTAKEMYAKKSNAGGH